MHDRPQYINGFPDYVIHPDGAVENLFTGEYVYVETSDHRETVRLLRDGKQYRRGLRKLMNEAFGDHSTYPGWFAVPGFENYEINFQGECRNARTQAYLTPQYDSGTYFILYRDGRRHKRSVQVILDDIRASL